MMEFVWLFAACFFNVFLLGLSSQFVRDQQVALAFTVSWGISSSQFVFTRVVSSADSAAIAFWVSGWAGAAGICSSIVFYKWFNPRYRSWAEAKDKRNSQ